MCQSLYCISVVQKCQKTCRAVQMLLVFAQVQHPHRDWWLSLVSDLGGEGGRTLSILCACLASLAIAVQMNVPLIACVVRKIVFDTLKKKKRLGWELGMFHVRYPVWEEVFLYISITLLQSWSEVFAGLGLSLRSWFVSPLLLPDTTYTYTLQFIYRETSTISVVV